MIQIHVRSADSISMIGSVEHFEANECKAVLQATLKDYSDRKVDLDLSQLSSVSSVALSFLLYGLRVAKDLSCSLHYSNMSSELFNMARVSGIESMLIRKEDS